MANFEGANSTGVESGNKNESGLNNYIAGKFDSSLTWDDVKWLISLTKLPVVVKGILRADDALKALEVGCKGIMVSNHGARQIDTVPSTIEVLPEIVAAVQGRVPVMLDGGIRLGTDVIKALALGATCVFMGRPAIWGLAINGQAGVEDLLQLLKREIEVGMCIMGTPTVKDITRDLVASESFYSSKL